MLICIQLWRLDMLKDAPVARSVEELGGQHIVYAHHAQRSKEDDGKQCPAWRSEIIQPLVAPEPGGQCRAKVASWIQAGALIYQVSFDPEEGQEAGKEAVTVE